LGFLFRLPTLLLAQQRLVALRVLPAKKLQLDPRRPLNPLRHAQQGLLEIPLGLLAGQLERLSLRLQLRAGGLREGPRAEPGAEHSQDETGRQEAQLHVISHQRRPSAESHFRNRSSGMASATSANRLPTMCSACLSNTATGLLGSWFSNHSRASRMD
jgi:hypothetical protein